VAEKIARLGIERDKDRMYYVKDGAAWSVQRKAPGVPQERPSMVADAGLVMDTAYIYFVDSDGDISRARRPVERNSDDDGDEDAPDTIPEPAEGDTKELLYTLFPELEVPENTQNILVLQDEASRLFAEVRDIANLRSLTPRQFEQLLAEVFNREGYETHLTPPAKDGGRDVIAVLPGPLPCLVVAEAKHMQLVKPTVVQALWGVQYADKAHMGLVATTGRFSEKTRKMTTRQWGRLINLRDGAEFISWMETIRMRPGCGPNRR
jgi:HJR/Mrr/RecB family endonuclease